MRIRCPSTPTLALVGAPGTNIFGMSITPSIDLALGYARVRIDFDDGSTDTDCLFDPLGTCADRDLCAAFEFGVSSVGTTESPLKGVLSVVVSPDEGQHAADLVVLGMRHPARRDACRALGAPFRALRLARPRLAR